MDLALKSDAELLELSQREPRAFGVLIERYQTPFLRRACQILRNVDEAEDAVQDALVRIYLHARQFNSQAGAEFSSWGYKILLNVCLTRYRKLQRERAAFLPLDREDLAGTVGTELEFDRKLKLDYLVSLLGLLPELWRRTMTLHYLKGWSYWELAKSEQVSPSTIRSRIHRAKKFLLQKFYEQRDA